MLVTAPATADSRGDDIFGDAVTRRLFGGVPHGPIALTLSLCKQINIMSLISPGLLLVSGRGRSHKVGPLS